MKITAISDTHKQHRQVKNIPDGDVLVHAGDITNQGEISVLKDFAFWMKSLPHKYKIVISGNHDFPFDRNDFYKKDILDLFTECGLIYLENSGVTIEGIHFYGYPQTPIWHSRWAFNMPRGGPDMKKLCAKIPKRTNVLVSHGPPHLILDKAPRDFGSFENTGCELLAKRIKMLPKLQAHIFGHIHEGYGIHKEGNVIFANSALCAQRKQLANSPHSFEI